MARGRMITNQICRDKAVHQLSNDLSRLAFTWLITFADCEGRVFGDPAIIKSALFPRREDINTDQMTLFIAEWAAAGLIVWYECEGDQWICFPKFEKNQPGLRKDREPESDIPEYSADTCRIIAGSLTDKIPVKRREENGREENGREEPPDLFTRCLNVVSEITGLPPDHDASKAIDEIIKMEAMKVDMQAGYNWVVNVAKKPFKYYGQLVGPTRTAMAMRLQKNNTTTPQPLTEQELRRSIEANL
jgi:hypothetical protein